MQRVNKTRHLRPLKLTKRSTDFFVFDVETGKEKSDGSTNYFLSARPEHLIFGCIYGKNFKKVLHTPDEFKREFKKRRYRNKIVYAHNAEYDLSTVYDNIYYMDSEAIFNGKFISASNGNCRFADSFNILPSSLKDIGEKLGFPKLILGDELLTSFDRKKDIEYCMRDCEIVYIALEKAFENLEPCFTIGSLSLKDFRKNYLKETIKVSELSDEFFDALYGGRTEAFRLGKCEGYVYDRNSSYPASMLEERFPDPRTLRRVYNPTIGDLENLEGMVNATVTIRNTSVPSLPFRTENSLIFPIGTFTGSWCLPEFRYAIDNYHIDFTIHYAIVSEPINSPFKDFINDNWEARESSDNEFNRYFYKLKMNNLYGKLIQRERTNYKFFPDMDRAVEWVREKKLRAEIIPVNRGVFVHWAVRKKFSHTIACLGAYITAYARVALMKFIVRNGITGIMYCDTDSTVFPYRLSYNDKHLGGWKRENKKVIEIRALKDYVVVQNEKNEKGEMRAVTKRIIKGVKKKAIQVDESATAFRFLRMIKTRESFIRLDNLPAGTFIEQTKYLTGDYNKRIINKDRKTTKPIEL